MKRLLLGIVAASYLALVGVQAAHVHKSDLDSKPDSCAVCATADQAVRQSPNAAPAVAQPCARGKLVAIVPQSASSPLPAPASARSPPPAA